MLDGGAGRFLVCAAFVPLAALVALAGLACGPSYQALYEGDVRFEHCYALEESGATMQQKSDCWADWTKRYTYGQTRDRVEYAIARYRALSRAPQAPTDEAMMQAAPGEGRGAGVAAPAPTSAFAPPPTMLEATDAGVAGVLPDYAADAGVSVVNEESAPAPPGSSCGTGCDSTWNRCRSSCTGAKCDACAATYKRCMRDCFAK
jgi:hypothetical protein